ncbi:MAG: hypothetical protein Q9201_005234 [Fulgogasparrea decipioides]
MTKLPSVSLRKHYRSVPGEPSEPTSTIVLTSPQCFFVDVRVFKGPQQEPLHSSAYTNASKDLQWAFAGTSQSFNDLDGKRYSIWDHWIDSLTDHPPPDRGEMITLDNGDVLERGSTLNEKTGEVELYEELWTDLPMDAEGLENGHVCVVLRTESEEGKTKGMVVKIRDWCQGMLKIGNEVTVERWQWTQDAVQKNTGKWGRTVRIGKAVLPCTDLLGDKQAQERTNIQCDGVPWKVIEVTTW